jgi:galactonate dehydratase
MQISRLEVVRVGVNHRGDWLFVRLWTDDGQCGIGEASHGGRAGRDAVVSAVLTDQCAPILIGRDPQQVVAATAALWPLGTGRAGSTAVSACEQALWDLAGKAANAPIHQMLGGAVRSRIPLYANINRATTDRTPAGFASNAVAALAEGYSAVKLAPFDGMSQQRVQERDQRPRLSAGLACVAAVREAAGNDIEVFVDCHSMFDVPTAMIVANELRALGVTWFEEPLPDHDREGLARVREATPDLQLVGGEERFGLEGFWPFLKRGLWDVIMPDVKHCGGIGTLRAIAEVGTSLGVSVSPHNPSGPVSLAASAQVAAVMPVLRYLEHAWGEVDWRHTLVSPRERIEQGHYVLPEGAGLGIELDDAVVLAHAELLGGH